MTNKYVSGKETIIGQGIKHQVPIELDPVVYEGALVYGTDGYVYYSDGLVWTRGVSGYSGYSGNSGYSGYSGYSGISGYSGFSGFSGFSGISGFSGLPSTVIDIKGVANTYADLANTSASNTDIWFVLSNSHLYFYDYTHVWIDLGQIMGTSGFSGYSGSGVSGFSGYSGYSGYSGESGWSGESGYSGWSGESGYSGFSGINGTGAEGQSGYSGYSGISGFSGKSGWSGEIGESGYSGYSGQSGRGITIKGTVASSSFLPAGATVGDVYIAADTGHGWISDGLEGWTDFGPLQGPSGYSGYSGRSGYSGTSGYSGSGVSGYSGYSGKSGYSGYSGRGITVKGTVTTSSLLPSGAAEGDIYIASDTGHGWISDGNNNWTDFGPLQGPSGFSGYSGRSGYSGISGYSGWSGYSGINGGSGYSGLSGYSGKSGYSGYSGYSGISGYSGYSGETPYTFYYFNANTANIAPNIARDTLNILPGANVVITGYDSNNTIYIDAKGDGSANTLRAVDDGNTNAGFYPVMVVSTNSNVASQVYTSTTKLYFNPLSGTLSATNFNSLSDMSLKDNLNEIDDALSIIDSLKGFSFNWKDNGNKAYGFIAQEVEKVMPELVGEMAQFKTVSYMQLIPILVQAIKELKEQIKK